MPNYPKSRRPSYIAKNKPLKVVNNDKFYNSSRWRKVSKAFRTLNPYCYDCILEGNRVLARITDHVIPIERGGARFEWANFQGQCHSHHQKKRGRERHGLIEPYRLSTTGKIPIKKRPIQTN